jgi:hypothetical protein
VSTAVGRLAAELARRTPPLGGLLADRDRWRAEALDRRERAAALRRRLDGVQAAAGRAERARDAARAGRLADREAAATERAALEQQLRAATEEAHQALAAARSAAATAAAREQKLSSELKAEQAHYAWLRKGVGSWLPGHYYSPIPDWDEIRERADSIFSRPDPQSLTGIDFRAADQLARLPEFRALYSEHPFPIEPEPGHRYCLENRFFGWADGLILYCMLRSLKPARVLEIGSGWSSALLLDVNDQFFDSAIDVTFVEPFPERLHGLLRDSDRERATIIEAPLWKVGDEPFRKLRAGDILFIDSTHVSRIGSDVNRLILDVLPNLPAGVHVHIHDIFYPFEYPREWVEDGRAWNEAYLLRAYLTDNPTIRITWSNSYLDTFHEAEVAAAMPQWSTIRGGSIWLETLPGPGRRE